MAFLKNIVLTLWRNLVRKGPKSGLIIGFAVRDDQATRRKVILTQLSRSEHIAILGKTGTGKSSLLRYFMSQDIRTGLGFVCIDLHGDLIPFALSTIAEHEQKTGEDLSRRLLLIDPSDLKYSVGLNLLEPQGHQNPAVHISEMVGFLKHKWDLDHFGARTEELLRNSLWVLSANGLTLLEITPLLTNPAYRRTLLQQVTNQEVKRFFEDRYNQASVAMQSVMREAVLNKITAFTVDPAIRHIVGQQQSSISLRTAIDQGFWILLDLRKGKLGENASTFAGLFLSKLKGAIFGRAHRSLFTVYADELPNLVATDDAFLTLLSEARKFAVSVVSANQFLNQFTQAMKSALFSVGTALCFQLSAEDAPFMAKLLAGEKTLARRLTTLEHRHLIGKFGEFTSEVLVPSVRKPEVSFSSLIQRSLQHFGKTREQIEKEINARRPAATTEKGLDDWD